MSCSAICEGKVYHARQAPRPHSFRYRIFLLDLDLDELPELFRGRWLWSARRPSLAWFRRADYLGPRQRPLREAVLDRVESELGRRPAGSVRVLTHVRTLGYLFNPVSFYFCHGADGALDAFMAEITNTPWGERHAYVLDARSGADRRDGELCWRFDKAFHVSPFHSMQQVYEWRLRQSAARVEIHLANLEHGREVFRAGLVCARVPITRAGLARVLVRHPALGLRLHAAIYWQAALLWAKGTPFFAHPRKRRTAGGAPSPR